MNSEFEVPTRMKRCDPQVSERFFEEYGRLIQQCILTALSVAFAGLRL